MRAKIAFGFSLVTTRRRTESPIDAHAPRLVARPVRLVRRAQGVGLGCVGDSTHATRSASPWPISLGVKLQ